MKVIVNEEKIDVPEEFDLLGVLKVLNVAPDARGIAVAVNDRVVRRADWGRHAVAPHDRIEVIQATQGG